MRNIYIFFQLTKANLNALLSFKIDFLVSFFAGLLSQTIGILFLSVLFMNIPSVADWNVYQVGILYGFIFFAEGIMTLSFQGTFGLANQVRSGTLDQYLLRPLPISTQIYGQRTNLAGLGTSITGLAVITYSILKLDMVLPLWKINLLILSLILGAVIRVNINFAFNSISLWLEGAAGVGGTVYSLQELAKYPIDIYPRAFQVMLLTLFPFAAISYVPAAVILNKIEPLFYIILPIVTVVIVVIRKFIFWQALKVYEGAGN